MHKAGKETGKKNADAQTDLLWGINAVLEFCTQNPKGLSEILIQRGKAGPKLQNIIDLARENGVKLRFVEKNRLGAPTGCKHQGVVAKQSQVELLDLEELLDSIPAGSSKADFPRLLVLDSLQDPQNMGAILRSALAAGFTDVIITRERTAPLSGVVSRVSAGAVARLRICRVVNLSETLKKLKSKGFWVFGAVVGAGAESLYECDFDMPLCLVIGGEGGGIRPLVKKQCDHLITIPMRSDFDSLNASAAAAVIMFEILRRRLAA